MCRNKLCKFMCKFFQCVEMTLSLQCSFSRLRYTHYVRDVWWSSHTHRPAHASCFNPVSFKSSEAGASDFTRSSSTVDTGLVLDSHCGRPLGAGRGKPGFEKPGECGASHASGRAGKGVQLPVLQEAVSISHCSAYQPCWKCEQLFIQVQENQYEGLNEKLVKKSFQIQ